MRKTRITSFKEYNRRKTKLVEIILVLKEKLRKLEEEYKNLCLVDEKED